MQPDNKLFTLHELQIGTPGNMNSYLGPVGSIGQGGCGIDLSYVATETSSSASVSPHPAQLQTTVQSVPINHKC